MKVWRIIPGEPDYRSTILGKFIRENYVAIGWNPVRDLTNISEDELETVCRSNIPKDWGESSVIAAIRSFREFRYEMDIGDIVIVSADGFVYAIGKIRGAYYKKEEPSSMPEDIWTIGFYSYYHRRDVEWMKLMKFPFENLPENLKNKLGTPPTIMELSLDEGLTLLSTLS